MWLVRHSDDVWCPSHSFCFYPLFLLAGKLGGVGEVIGFFYFGLIQNGCGEIRGG